MPKQPPPCQRCRDVRWVCEDHHDQPYRHFVGDVRCNGAGAPCPDCNDTGRARPAMPPCFRSTVNDEPEDDK